MIEAKWDGLRLLVAIDLHGRMPAWSRRATSLGDRLGSLLEPFAELPRATVFDAERVALSSRDGRAVASQRYAGLRFGPTPQRWPSH
jgi:ATP-dependent DNA ligase